MHTCSQGCNGEPEKQVDIFRDLKEQLPEYEFVVCQETELNYADLDLAIRRLVSAWDLSSP